MDEFADLLDQPLKVAEALRSIQISEKERDSLRLLYASKVGFEASRDSGNRVRAETVYHCSKIGAYLTKHFDGIGPRDTMMWVGCILPNKGGTEYWIMRPQFRAAMDLMPDF